MFAMRPFQNGRFNFNTVWSKLLKQLGEILDAEIEHKAATLLDNLKHFVKGHLHFFFNNRFHFSPYFHKRFLSPFEFFRRK